MSEELIKALRLKAEVLAGLRDATASLLTKAADALESRPAPVQVPEGMVLVQSDVAEEAADYLRDAAATLKARHSPIEGEWGQYSIDKQARREHDAMLRVADMLAAAPSAPATPSVDAERVMALVEEYGRAMGLCGLGHANAVKVADDTLAQIRALLTPAIANQGEAGSAD